MHKKAGKILIIMLFIYYSFSNITANALTNKNIIVGDLISIESGQVVQIPVKFHQDINEIIDNFNFSLKYNVDVLEPILNQNKELSYEVGNDFKNNRDDLTVNIKDGKIYILYINNSNDSFKISNDSDIIKLNFKVITKKSFFTTKIELIKDESNFVKTSIFSLNNFKLEYTNYSNDINILSNISDISNMVVTDLNNSSKFSKGEVAKIKLNILNNHTKERNIKTSMAIFNNENSVVLAESRNIKVKETSSQNVDFEIDLNKITFDEKKKYYIKYFVWDTEDNMKPLCGVNVFYIR